MILRLWLFLVLVCMGALAPSRACAHVAETRTGDFFAATTESRQQSAPQVADWHQANPRFNYETALGYSQAAESRGQGFTAAEQRIADYIEQTTGIKSIPNPAEGVPGAGRQGDAFIAGAKHEFKTLDPGATANTIKNQVNNSIRGEGQAREIIIDARGSGLTMAAAEQGAYKALGISRGKVDGITIIGDGFFFRSVPK